MTPAIKVENLGKRYCINHEAAQDRYGTLREQLMNWVTAPLRRLREKSPACQNEDFWALNDVSFKVEPGEVLGIIGRNGAGKSTLLKILSRITKPTKGQVTLRGRVGSLLEVGTGFHHELTGRENIYLNGAILGMSRAEIQGKFDEIVAFSEIEQFLDTPVKRYSSGMYIRLAFAVAAHLEPEILIVDEVLAVGDLRFQKKCLGKMQQVATGGKTVLFVSHNLPTIKALCKRAILLSRGKVQTIGTPDVVVSTYLSEDLTFDSGFNSNRRKDHSGACTITSAYIAAEGCAQGSIEWNVPFEIHMDLEVMKSITIAPEYLIRDSEQLPILYAPTGLNQGFRAALSPGRYRITSRCAGLRLASGQYYVDVMIAETGHRFLDCCECALTFAVEKISRPPHGWCFTQERKIGCIPLDLTTVVTAQ